MFRWIVTLLLFVAGSAAAVTKVDIYSTELLLPAGAKQDKVSQAIGDGLLQVLEKVMGEAPNLSSAEQLALKQKASGYLDSYGFHETNETLKDRLGEAVAAQRLSLHYNADKVLQLVKRNSWPIWTDMRPEVLVWPAVADRFALELLNYDQHQTFLSSISETAKLRGLPLMLPLLDLEDQQNKVPERLWFDRYNMMPYLEQRYEADAVSKVLLNKVSDNQWRLQWQWQEQMQADITAQSLDDLARQYVNGLANLVAKSYQVSRAQGSGLWLLKVSAVDSYERHVKLLRYLNSVPVFNGVKLLQVQGDELIFRVETPATINQIRNLLRLDRRLEEDQSMQLFTDELNFILAR